MLTTTRPDHCPNCGTSTRTHTGAYCQRCGHELHVAKTLPFGIVWDAHEAHPSPPKRHSGDHRDMGTTIFATTADRQRAIDWLRALGYRYFVPFNDVQGYGLSWAWGFEPLRPEARDRLPSTQRARRNERARRAFASHIHRHPSYDLH